jgi:predicted HTH transcriptional regulator
MSYQQEEELSKFLFGKPLEKVTCKDILNILEVAHESPYIEFKESVKDKEDMKRKILENVTAFLNSRDGRGFIVFGVKVKMWQRKLRAYPRAL